MVFVHSRKDTVKTAQKLVYPYTFQLNVINLDEFHYHKPLVCVPILLFVIFSCWFEYLSIVLPLIIP